MKKFLLRDCLINANGLLVFLCVSLGLFLVCRLIGTGSLVLQLISVLFVLYFLFSSLVGLFIVLFRIIRFFVGKVSEKRKTERDLDK